MGNHVNTVLDNELSSRHVQIYEVDGLRGTLKELSDYFNVDPVSVSNLLSDGNSIQDALCLAESGFKPVEKEKNNKVMEAKNKARIIHYSSKIEHVIKEIFDEYISDPNCSQSVLAKKYGVSGWSICANLALYAEKTGQTELYDSVKKSRKSNVINKLNKVPNDKAVKVDNKASVKVPAVKNENKAEEYKVPISTKSVSDVQDLGDLIVITTTTTVVYRKVHDI